MGDYLKKYNTVFNPWELYNCPVDGCNFEANFGPDLFSHLNRIHKNDPKFTCACLFSINCFNKTTFKSFGGLNKHMHTYHKSFFKNSEQGATLASGNQQEALINLQSDDVQGKYSASLSNQYNTTIYFNIFFQYLM